MIQKLFLFLLLFIGIQAQTKKINEYQTLVLNIAESSINKEHNTTLKVEAVYKDTAAQEVTDKVTWLITPSDAIRIEGHTLTALKDGNVTLQAEYEGTRSDPVTLTVYWEVDGHRLPPEPDPKVNNATLLGVDVNHNGVRDDVERWIYETYDHPIERGILMQSARAYTSVLSQPFIKHQPNKDLDKAISCYKYWIYKAEPSPFDEYEFYYHRTELKKRQFNNVNRMTRKHKYEASLSGGVYSLLPKSKDACSFDENGSLKDFK
ncbi:hypothetical protein [Hydrogenimonas sp.]